MKLVVSTHPPVGLLECSDRELPAAVVRRLSERLTFAFARGTEEGDLLGLLSALDGDFRQQDEGLGKDLFLDELLERAFPLSARGIRYEACRPFLRKLFLAPPKRIEDTLFRQSIFAELADQGRIASEFELVYEKLRAFRAALCQSERMGGKFGALRRRLEILVAFRDAAQALSVAFSGAASGLSRLGVFGEGLVKSVPFERLAQLLAFEDERTVIDGRIQLGFDGTLRRFDIVGVSEAERRPFARGALSRIGRAIWGLLRGYRFSEEDVMSSLLDQTFTEFEGDVVRMLRISLELEFYLAGLGFKRFVEDKGASACLPKFSHDQRSFVNLKNPWLLLGSREVVGIDLGFKREDHTVIVTGPNSGGKTRLLQSVAVSQLLAQLGMWVSATSAEVLWAESFFLGLVERPASDQEEGRLGMELLRIRRVFERAGPGALVVMDELCSGTNPSEGEEIFEMVLELFREVKPQVLLSTHFLDFAARMRDRNLEGLRFLQVELGAGDVPSFRFVDGVAKTSMARATAARLGVTREELFSLATRRASRDPE